MLLILDKINQQKPETFQLLLENMEKWGATEEEIFYVYIKFLNQNLIPNWTIFNIVFPILQKKEKDRKKNPTEQLLKLGTINLKTFLLNLIVVFFDIFELIKSKCLYNVGAEV